MWLLLPYSFWREQKSVDGAQVYAVVVEKAEEVWGVRRRICSNSHILWIVCVSVGFYDMFFLSYFMKRIIVLIQQMHAILRLQQEEASRLTQILKTRRTPYPAKKGSKRSGM